MAKDIQNIGVVGAGQMGHGIALVCALAGFDVRILDLTTEALDKGMKAIQRDLQREVDKKRMTQDKADAAVKRIKTTTAYEDLKDRDLVIEAATEDEKIKKEIIKKICPVLGPDAYLATNTSSISITRLGAGSDRPGRFVGMHFMNPVPRMELVELIRGIATEEETYRLIRELTVKLGKTPVNAEDFPAFIVNRILLPMLNEAVYTLYEGVGSVDAIDTAMKLGTHHPMGPFELADFIGLDVCLAVMQVLHEGLSDSKYRPCPLLVKYVEAGWLGRKTGRGFYDYSGPKPVPTR
jgi:3-hydroxybutyryl-CoA dehydrogenase